MANITIDTNYIWLSIGVLALLYIFYIIHTAFINKKVKNIEEDQNKDLLNHVSEVLDKADKEKPKKAKINLKSDKKAVNNIVPKKEDDKADFVQLEDFNVLKRKRSKMNLKYWADRLNERFFPYRVILARFEMSNGNMRDILVKINKDAKSFNLLGGVYVIDKKLLRWNQSSKIYQLSYHENYNFPFDTSYPEDEINNVLSSQKITNLKTAFNPLLVAKFIRDKITEGLMKSSVILEALRKTSFYILMILIIVGLHFALFLHVSGLLSNLNIGI